MLSPTDFNSIFSQVLAEKLDDTGMTIFKLSRLLRSNGSKLRLPQVKQLTNPTAPIPKKWDATLAILARIFVCHPAEFLGYQRPPHSWPRVTTPHPAPLCWALAGRKCSWLAARLSSAIGEPILVGRVYGWLYGKLYPLDLLPSLADVLQVEPQQLVPLAPQSKDLGHTRVAEWYGELVGSTDDDSEPTQ